jgi:nicotinamidase-related amidase
LDFCHLPANRTDGHPGEGKEKNGKAYLSAENKRIKMEANSNPGSQALLVMDVQAGTVKRLKDPGPLIKALSRAVETARAQKIPVIYVVVGFREGYPEVSPSNKSFSAIRANPGFSLDREETFAVYPAVAPAPGEVVVVKKRISAFTGSDLEVILRAGGITSLVLTGIATSGVVLSTLREAADKDFRVTVLSDCCADADEEVHRVLMTKVFPRQAEVMESADWK